MRAPLRSALALVTVLVASLDAGADVPPPDSCGAVDQACPNATDGGVMGVAGICRPSTCMRPTPSGPVSYACNRCVANAANSGSGGGSSGGVSCSVSAPGATTSGSGLAVALALLALAASRRAR